MPPEESTFRPAMKLMSGRMAAFAITFVCPILLVRLFTQSEFGTYKQFMLMTYTPYLIGCAFSECLFYFLPKDPARAGRYVLNSLMMLFASGTVCLIAMVLNGPRIASIMNNSALAPYFPLMGLYLLFTLASTVLEITMISRKQYSVAAGTYVASDLLRAGFLVVPALITRSLEWALIGSVLFFACRLCAALAYFRWEFGSGMTFDKRLLKEQWAYALPYSLAGIVYVVQQNYHQYAVAFHFDAATFAIYSVGCLQIPLVDFLATPTSNVMMVRMAETLRDGECDRLLPIWHDTTRKLALLFFPLVGLLFVNAYQIITLLFTRAYAASVPIFMVWCLSILLAAFQTDGVLRVFAEIRYLFVTNVVRLGMLLLMMNWFLKSFGLMGAVMITLAGIVLAKIMAMVRMRRTFQTTYAELLPWRTLALTLLAAMMAGIPALILDSKLAIPTLAVLPISGLVYTAIYVALVLILKLLSKEEIDAIKNTLCIWDRRSGMLPAPSARPGGLEGN
jgi:O-antigen/teichoic acid export membrane protein